MKDMNSKDMSAMEMTETKLDLNELEQVNGGFVLAAFIVAGIGGAIAGAITYYELKR